MSEMLYITRKVHDDLIQCCQQGFPLEVCGFIAASKYDLRIGHRFISIPNTHSTPHKAYRMDEEAQRAAYAEFDERGWEPIIAFHSHPVSGPFMSDVDLDEAVDLSLAYLIVGPVMQQPPLIAAYRVRQLFIGSDMKSWERVNLVTLDPDDPAATDG